MAPRKSRPQTRERILRAALKLFAKRGFHGVSLRDIGKPLGLANSSLIHHFPTKEKLYAAVLEGIAANLARHVEPVFAETEHADQLAALFRAVSDWTAEYPAEAEVSLRELLDNRERAARARHWPMTPVVKRLMAMLEEAEFPTDPTVTLFHIVGSAMYFHAALPTIARLDGERTTGELLDLYREQVLDLHLRALTA